jgi:hypothetical protein
MALKRSEHCRREDRHAGHSGQQRWWGGQVVHVYCDGTPEFLARELEREAKPPPGPPSPPRPRIAWDEPTSQKPEDGAS